MTSSHPPARRFAAIDVAFTGFMNWPFFTNTARPVAAAASRRSSWRHRNAGTWR
jgi:hypothetical protein